MRDFYYKEWKNAEKEGNDHYAILCRLKYLCLVKDEYILRTPHKQYIDALKAYPPIYLN